MTERPRTIAIDLDNVIRDMKTDEPIEGAIETIDKLIEAGFEIVVHTANDETFANQWLLEHWDGEEDVPTATNTKPQAIAYIDDRAIRFTNWNDIKKYFL